MSVKINSYKGRSIRPVYKARIKKDEYSNAIDRICNRYKLGHIKQNESGREYKNRMNKMFPLTVTPPKYKETFVIVLVDKFCSFNEVLDDFIHRKFCGAKDTRIKWFGASKGEKR